MMKTGARAAAVLLALALGVAGCKPSSLTPFGIDTKSPQDYDNTSQNVNGTWTGKTASGGDVNFQVGSDTVSKLVLNHVAAGCTITFEAADVTAPVVNDGFTLEKAVDAGGRIVITGTFSSASTSSGSYFFEGLPAGVCPTSGTGTFGANKI